MKRKSNIPEEKLLPYDTICAATRGDPDAILQAIMPPQSLSPSIAF